MATSGGIQSGGGGVTFPDYTGSGTPEGVQTGNVGESYVDTTNGGLWWKRTGAATNTGWRLGSVIANGDETVPWIGYEHNGNGNAQVIGPGTGFVAISDIDGYNGTGNQIVWSANGNDGQQFFAVTVGATGNFTFMLAADGTVSLPNATLAAGDLTFDDDTHGPVVVDQSDGHTYRIISTAGILSTVMVT